MHHGRTASEPSGAEQPPSHKPSTVRAAPQSHLTALTSHTRHAPARKRRRREHGILVGCVGRRDYNRGNADRGGGMIEGEGGRERRRRSERHRKRRAHGRSVLPVEDL
ncbi:hypothetical protein HGRIS_011465 [Hohenbuehelia grisea]|uniref:Uncharacterized protein n=1 Tax=Hohenbuehelia grisea TaxID=104357 RepID=A0ABR3JWI4_9AGAR